MVAENPPIHLLLLCTRRNNEPVVLAKASRLHQYRSFCNAYAIGFAQGEGFEKTAAPVAHGRVDDGAEFCEQILILKDDGAEFPAVDGTIRVENGFSELSDDGVVGFGAFRHDLVAEIVGLYQKAAEVFESPANEGFAGGISTGEAYAEHPEAEWRSAKATVFAINIAIVNGPTPP